MLFIFDPSYSPKFNHMPNLKKENAAPMSYL